MANNLVDPELFQLNQHAGNLRHRPPSLKDQFPSRHTQVNHLFSNHPPTTKNHTTSTVHAHPAKQLQIKPPPNASPFSPPSTIQNGSQLPQAPEHNRSHPCPQVTSNAATPPAPSTRHQHSNTHPSQSGQTRSATNTATPSTLAASESQTKPTAAKTASPSRPA
jgi:hypothetical protein